MIYTNVTVRINSNGTATANSKVLLYRGDREVEIQFTLVGNPFIVENSSFAQLIITRTKGGPIFTEISPVRDGKVILTITAENIDQITEVGFYNFQIRLFDDDLSSRVTLPPIENGLEVKEPIADDESATIGRAMVNYSRLSSEIVRSGDTTFDEYDNYNRTNWQDGDFITDVKMNKIEDALYTINQRSLSNVTAAYISSAMNEDLSLNIGDDLLIIFDFVSPNLGRGTLKVNVNDSPKMSMYVEQEETTLTIPEEYFTIGTNKLTMYVVDRAGKMSNELTFTVRYGSTSITSDFNSSASYDVGSVIRYYFTPSALDTSLSLTFYMVVDGLLQGTTECTSDKRGYYTFPTSMEAGGYRCQAYVIDGDGNMSNILKFNLVILSSNTLVVVSEVDNITVEEGNQLSIDYRAYMIGQNSFITKTYIDDELVNVGTCGLDVSYFRTSSLREGNHVVRLEVYNSNETVSDSIEWNVTVTPSSFIKKTPVTTGALFIASALDRSNSDANNDQLVGVDQDGDTIIATLEDFSYDSESGWVDNELVFNGASSLTIPVSPLANNARYGFTLDIEFTSRMIGVDDALVLDLWDYNKNCGVKITTENLILRSAEGNECNLYFEDNANTSVIFVIDRNEKKAKIYLNGVMCSAFQLSDYTVNGETFLEDFSVAGNIRLGGSGYCKLKNIRVYQIALTTEEIMNNFIANKISASEQFELTEFQKGNSLPTMTIYCDFSGLGKDDKKPCKITYVSTDEEKYGESFTLDHKQSSLQYQGTSSMAYPIKNYRINLADENGNKWRYNFPYGKPEHRFTLKADFMSSGHWQNTGLTKWINGNLYNYNPNDEKSMNPKKWFDIHNGGNLDDTRECIYGFPCRLILVNDGSTALNEGQNEPSPGNTKDMGIFNFNHDKDNTDTMGFDSVNFPNCLSFEVTANSDTSAGAFISYTPNDDQTELEYLQESFEMRFPDPEDYDPWHGYSGLKRLIDWVDNCSDAEFVSDFEQYFHKDYTLRYYLLVITLGMVDNLGKNMMLDTWDCQLWMPRFYDCDTICSYSNDGTIKFDVDIEMEQGYWNTSSSRLWTRIRDLMHPELVAKYADMRANGLTYESLMQCFYDEQIAKIPQTYYNMDADVKYLPFGDEYLGKAHGDGYEHLKRWLKNRLIFTDTLFDYSPSYENDILTIRANTTELMNLEIETYTPVYQHLSWYNGQMDKTKINKGERVTFSGRAAAATDQEILIYGGSNIKKIGGITSTNPNAMLIGGASRLTELIAPDCPILTDINANKANLAPHLYLNKVDLSGCPQLGGNLRLNNSPLIRDINIEGTAITGINFPPNAKNLETLNIPDSITNLTIRGAMILTNLELPSSIEYLSLINTPKLRTISVTSCENLTTLIMEKPASNPFTLIAKAPNIQNIRLIDINVQTTTEAVQKLLNVNGLDAAGNIVDAGEAVTGTITLTTCSANLEAQLKAAYPHVTFIVLNYSQSYNVTFLDGDDNVLYETEVLANGEAIYVGPTPSKTETAQYSYVWNGWNTTLKPIIGNSTIRATFDSILKYYDIYFYNGDTMEVVSHQYLGYGSTPTIPEFPSGLNMWSPVVSTVRGPAEYIAKYAPYPEDINVFSFNSSIDPVLNSITYYVWLKATSSYPAPVNAIFPFEYNNYPVTRIVRASSNLPTSSYCSAVENVYIPETVNTIAGYMTPYSNVKGLDIPSSVHYIYNGAFAYMSKLEYINAPGCQYFGHVEKYTSLSTGSSYYSNCYNCSNLKYIILGSEEYPFKEMAAYRNTNMNMPFYGATNLVFINLVTENGLESDVNFSGYEKATSTSGRNYEYIFTKKPITVKNVNGISYALINNEYAVMGLYDSSLTDITIPDTLDGIPVTKIMKRAFYDNTTLTAVRGMGNIKVIDDYAFYSSSSEYNLTTIGDVEGEINLPNLETVGNNSFRYRRGIQSVTCPKLISIGDYGMSNLYSVNRLSIPKVETIGVSAFYNCGYSSSNSTNDVELNTMEELVSLGRDAFYASKITSFKAPKLQVIAKGVFASCPKLKYVEIGSSDYFVTSIASAKTTSEDSLNSDAPFTNCYVLSHVIIYSDAESTTELASIYEPADGAYYIFGSMGDAVEYVGDNMAITLVTKPVELKTMHGINCVDTEKGLILMENISGEGEITFEESDNVFKISNKCFYNVSTTVTGLNVSSTLKYIGPYAFGGTYNTRNIITFIKGDFTLEYIGKNAFHYSDIATIGSEDGIVNLGDCEVVGMSAFYVASNIRLVIGEKVKVIKRTAFNSTTNLRTAFLPNVETAETGAFNASGVCALCFPKLTTIAYSICANCSNLQIFAAGSAEYPVTYIYTGYTNSSMGAPFGYCPQLINTLYLYTTSGTYSGVEFYDPSLYVGSTQSGSDYYGGTEYQYNSSYIKYHNSGECGMYRDGSYIGARYPDGFILLEDGINTSSEVITYPSTACGYAVTDITSIVRDNSTTRVINLPEHITTLPAYFGYYCSSLEKVTNVKTLKRIKSYCFCNCSLLTDVDGFDNLETLNSYAFNKTGITSFIAPNLTSLAINALEECASIEYLYLPKITSMGGNGTTGISCYYWTGLKVAVIGSKDYPVSYAYTYAGSSSDQAFYNTKNLRFLYIVTSPDYISAISQDNLGYTYYPNNNKTYITLGADTSYNCDYGYKDARLYIDDNYTAIIIDEDNEVILCEDKAKINTPTDATYNIPATIDNMSVTALGAGIYYNTGDHTAVNMPNTIKKVYSYAFYIAKVTTIRGAEGVEVVYNYGLSLATSTRNINTIGDTDNSIKLPSLTEAYVGAFYYTTCTDIYTPNLSTFKGRVFYNARISGNLYIGGGTLTNNTYAFYGTLMTGAESTIYIGSPTNPVTSWEFSSQVFYQLASSSSSIPVHLVIYKTPSVSITDSPWGASNLTYETIDV